MQQREAFKKRQGLHPCFTPCPGIVAVQKQGAEKLQVKKAGAEMERKEPGGIPLVRFFPFFWSRPCISGRGNLWGISTTIKKRRHEMKVVAFNGSARKDGNTAILVKEVFKELKKAGIRTELVQLAGKKIQGCIACGKCFENKDRRCVVKGDILNECIAKMLEADGIILASPTYFADISANMKALMERAGFVSRANGDMFRRKAGAAVVAVRRGGAIHAFDTMNHFFFISQMVVPGSSYWNVGIGLAPGDVKGDKEGLATMKVLGANMAWLLEKIHG
jgi:multimeric flavodoxin WrbA